MKKLKVGGLVVLGIVLIGLLFFASTYKFSDSHLRKDGVRVKLEDGALIVDGCEEDSANAIYCKRKIEVDGKDAELEFEFKDFKKNGYPATFTASINGHEFYRQKDLELETNMYADYQIFLNFNVIDKYVVFTYTKGAYGRSTTLYGVDTEGNIVLQEFDIDENDMLLKDYTDFITYDDDNVIIVYASRMEGEKYKEETICEANKKDVVEAYYTYTYKDGKFDKKQTKTISVADYIKENEIDCNSSESGE